MDLTETIESKEARLRNLDISIAFRRKALMGLAEERFVYAKTCAEMEAERQLLEAEINELKYINGLSWQDE